MEDVLQKLIKESLPKYSHVSSTAQKALDILESYTKAPPMEYRKTTLEAVRVALDSGNSKLTGLGATALLRMTKDNRFHTVVDEPEDDEGVWLSSQVLASVHSLENLNDNDKQEILKILLNMTCSSYWKINGRLVIQVISLSLDVSQKNNSSIKSASQALSCQTLREFSKHCNNIESDQNAADRFNESLPVLQFICSKLDEIFKNRSTSSSSSDLTLLLESLYSFLSSISAKIVDSPHFVRFVWQRFSPTLIWYLGIIPQSSTGKKWNSSSSNIKLDHQNCRTLLQIAMEIARLIGPVASLRPVLDSILHRILICPKIKDRLPALTSLTDMLNDSKNLINLSFVQDDPQSNVDTMTIFKLISKSLEECSSSNEDGKLSELVVQTLDCLRSLLKGLTSLSSGEKLNDELTSAILSKFSRLKEADYNGPSHYDVDACLPEHYKDIIRKEQQNNEDMGDDDDESVSQKSKEDEENSSMAEETQKKLSGDQEETGVLQGPDLADDIDEGIAGSDSDDTHSEDTEGPEEGFDNDEEIPTMDQFMGEAEEMEKESILYRQNKIPRYLHSNLQPEPSSQGQEETKERENAKLFVDKLKVQVHENLSSARGTIEIDHRLQQFASQFCHEFSTHSPLKKEAEYMIIMNADGVYLTSYLSLHLSMFMAINNYFNEDNKKYIMKREDFVNNVLGSGLLVYLSPVWLAQVYDLITDYDVFGFSLKTGNLKNILSDLDGFGCPKRGAQLMSEYRRLIKQNNETDHQSAGMRLARRILSTSWGSIISLLNKSLDPYLISKDPKRVNKSGNTSTNGFFRKKKKGEELLSTGIECLELATSLCSTLELHQCCGSVLAPLTSLICVNDCSIKDKKSGKIGGKVHLIHLQAVEKILMDSLELGSQSQDCWKHLMRCTTYVLTLESGLKKTLPVIKRKPPSNNSNESENNDSNTSDNFYKYMGQNALSFPIGMAHFEEGKKNMDDFLNKKQGDKYRTLSNDEATECINFLYHKIDRLFDDAASKLNLQSLMGFLSELCFCSHKELISIFPKNNLSTKLKRQKEDKVMMENNFSKLYEALLFHRISDVMLKCIKGGRPLIHIVRAWAIVGPHLMEAACHRELTISKSAVQHIHDIATAFLQNTSELTYFHFNEALFKPFENIVCLELCDTDIQDQVVSSICEFVEGYTGDIRSGWRPLFGTLKSVRFPVTSDSDADSAHIRAVLDVFEAFLSTNSPDVFANAALDCVGCLIKHVSNNINFTPSSRNLTKASLRYILRCHDILSTMYKMPSCPVFQGVTRIHHVVPPSVVDPIIPTFEVHSFDPSTDTISQDFDYSLLSTSEVKTNPILTDDSQGLLRVWFLLIDGLTSALTNCSKEYQSASVDTLFEILNSFVGEENVEEFGLYSTNHLLLPMLQNWLRRSQRTFQGWVESGPNFKHCMGKTTELVIKWLDKSSESTFLLKQLLLVITECTVVPVEGISRLGCACFRHIILSNGYSYNELQWELVCLSLCRASQLTLYPLHQLMTPFKQGSTNFYGDIGDVKIAARKDSCRKESYLLQLLGQQVLLLEQQRGDLPKLPDNPDCEERSLLFLLKPPGVFCETAEDIPDGTLRITLRSLLIGLSAHHILQQLMGTILLQGTKNVVPSLANLFLTKSPSMTPIETDEKSIASSSTKLPGMLDLLSTGHVEMLMNSLRCSYTAALEFDSRPGLKFLVQKVAQLKNAANLYKQSGAAWSLGTVANFELVVSKIRKDEITTSKVKEILESHEKKKNTKSFDEDEKGKNDEKNEIEYEYFIDLHDTFLEICETYVDIIVDKDGHRAKFDQLVRQPLYFFTADVDEFKDVVKRPSTDLTPEEQDESAEASINNDQEEDNEVFSESPDKQSEVDPKPFQFSDFYKAIPNESVVSGHSSPLVAESTIGGVDRVTPSIEDGMPIAREEVYRVATQVEMNSVISEFRYRKGKRSLPSTSSGNSTAEVKNSRRNPFLNNSVGSPKTPNRDIDPDIAHQQKESLMADSQAQIKVWTELVIVLLELSRKLPDGEYQVLLPLLFPGVRALAAHAQDPELKQHVADVFMRVASIYGFSPE